MGATTTSRGAMSPGGSRSCTHSCASSTSTIFRTCPTLTAGFQRTALRRWSDLSVPPSSCPPCTIHAAMRSRAPQSMAFFSTFVARRRAAARAIVRRMCATAARASGPRGRAWLARARRRLRTTCPLKCAMCSKHSGLASRCMLASMPAAEKRHRLCRGGTSGRAALHPHCMWRWPSRPRCGSRPLRGRLCTGCAQSPVLRRSSSP